MLRLRSANVREYEDQADIVVDVSLSGGRSQEMRASDRERLARLTNLLERTARDFIVETSHEGN